MAFTYDPTTARGKVRLQVGDTDSNIAIFDDAEIDAALSAEGQDIYKAAAFLCRALAANSTRIAHIYTIADFEMDKSKLPKYYMDLAASLEKKSGSVPVEQIDNFDHAIGEFGGDGTEYVGDNC